MMPAGGRLLKFQVVINSTNLLDCLNLLIKFFYFTKAVKKSMNVIWSYWPWDF